MLGRARAWTIAILLLWALAASWLAISGHRPQPLDADQPDPPAERATDRELQKIKDELTKWRILVTGNAELGWEEAQTKLESLRQRAASLPNTAVQEQPSLLQAYADALQRIATLERELTELRGQLRTAQLAAQHPATAQAVDEYVRELHEERLEEQQRMLAVIRERERRIQSLADRVQTLAKRLRDERQDKARLEAELLRELDRLRTALEELRRYRPKPAGVVRLEPDGRVVRANNVQRVVWISLGRRHGVQPGMTFNVWPSTASVALDKPKASIVVSRVIDRSLSEARIVAADPRHPIVDGDLICNAAFDPDRPTTFVLAGVIDIDGDGKDDRAIVRNCIKRSGGKIVAELLPDGTVQGEVRAEVRYFVRGEAAGAVRMARDRLEAEARDFGAYVLTVDKLIDLLGLPRVRRFR